MTPSVCWLGARLKQIASGGHVEHVRHSDAHMTIAFAAYHHNDLRLRIVLRSGEDAARVLDRKQLPVEVEHGPVADVLDARERKLLDAQHIGQRHRGAASASFHQQVVEPGAFASSLFFRTSCSRFFFACHGDAGASWRSIRDRE